MKIASYLLILFTMLAGCNSGDKSAETKEVIDLIAAEKNCNLSYEVVGEGKSSDLVLTAECDTTVGAFFTSSLYETIYNLRQKGIEYDAYQIKSKAGEVIWETNLNDFRIIQKKVGESTLILEGLKKGNIQPIVDRVNPSIVDPNDTTWMTALKEIEVPADAKFAGFDFIEEQMDGEKFMMIRFYFMGKSGKSMSLIHSFTDDYVYGFEG